MTQNKKKVLFYILIVVPQLDQVPKVQKKQNKKQTKKKNKLKEMLDVIRTYNNSNYKLT